MTSIRRNGARAKTVTWWTHKDTKDSQGHIFLHNTHNIIICVCLDWPLLSCKFVYEPLPVFHKWFIKHFVIQQLTKSTINLPFLLYFSFSSVRGGDFLSDPTESCCHVLHKHFTRSFLNCLALRTVIIWFGEVNNKQRLTDVDAADEF